MKGIHYGGRFRPRRLLPVLVAALVVLAGCGDDSGGGSDQAAESGGGGTLRVALVPAATANLPAQIAQEQGLFEQEGIDVKLETPTIPFSQLPATLGKQFDLVIGSQPDLIRAASSGIDVVAVSGLQKDDPKDPGAALVVPKGSPIKSIADLAGKSVGAPSTVGNNWSSLQCWAKKEGVDPMQIRGVEGPTPQLPELLDKGRFDAVLLFEPLLTPMVDGGAVAIGNAYEHCFGGAEYTSMWIANGAWAKDNQESVAKFLKALEAAKESMAENVDEARRLYIKTSGLPAAAAKRTPIIPSEFVFEQGEPIVADMKTWIELLKSLGTYKGDVDPGTLVLDAG